MNQRKPRPNLNWIANCPNALDLSVYPFRPHRGDYLLFLGRMSPDKGAHRAVAVAMEAGLPLKIAGKMREPKEREYFAEFVEPHLGDGIEWLGEVSHGEKVELLQHARATLFPIEWEEPFGLVMIESMACGTPVIATARGAVPEVIEHGRSGIIVDDYRIIPAALEQADRLDPRELRSYVEERFSPMRMVRDYVKAYEARRRTRACLRHQRSCTRECSATGCACRPSRSGRRGRSTASCVRGRSSRRSMRKLRAGERTRRTAGRVRQPRTQQSGATSAGCSRPRRSRTGCRAWCCCFRGGTSTSAA